MGERRRRPAQRHLTNADQEAFMKDVERRRKTAQPIDNFLVDADTGQVYLSSKKTAGGIDLIEEVTLSVPIAGFATMISSFIQIVFTPGELGTDGGAGTDGVIKQ
jgi:hypothetical protein